MLSDYQSLQARDGLGTQNGRPLVAAARAVLRDEPSIRYPSDGLALGDALVNLRDYGAALAEFQLAAEDADDYLTLVTANRDAGSSLFIIGDIAAGEAHFEAALNAHESFISTPILTVRFETLAVNLRWATSLAFVEDCVGSAARVEQARSVLNEMPVNERALVGPVGSTFGAGVSTLCPDVASEFPDFYPSEEGFRQFLASVDGDVDEAVLVAECLQYGTLTDAELLSNLRSFIGQGGPYDVYTAQLGSEPSVADHSAAASIMAQFIRERCA